MEKLFKLKEHNTTVRTEVIAGLTTFFAMAYIIFVNPGMLEIAGMDYTAVMMATCLSAALGTALTAFMANVPFAQAPGMGLNAFFTFTLCVGMELPWQTALALVLISGIIFLIIAISPLRSIIIASIPAPLKKAISAGIGLFIALIGLLNTGIITANGNLLDLGNITGGPALVALIGLLITGVLMARKVKGSIFIGIIATTLIGFIVKDPATGGMVTTLPASIEFHGFSALAPTFGKVFTEGFAGLGAMSIFSIVTALITLIICDMFDTVGTLIGTASNAGMLDKDGNLPKGDKAIIADAIATCAGAVVGTSTVTTFVESSTGISEGGRTGLTSLTVAILFALAAFFFAPIAGIVPAAATAPALIIVGVLMLKSTAEIDWNDFEIALPCFLTIAMMPFTYSISDGIGFGFIFYTLIKVFRGKAKEVPWLMYVLSLLFILMYILPLFE
ncbi:NCS2 family permease [Christensenellaceae bacterium OttesenSCG-928-M15]|nr:NCS2 family permease [Christensenellaceae bacterium OttesenSCG-928-M15]